MTDSINPSSIVEKSAKRSALQISTIGLCGLFLYVLHNCYQYMIEGVGYFFRGFIAFPLGRRGLLSIHYSMLVYLWQISPFHRG